MKTSRHSTLVSGTAPTFQEALGQATKFCIRNMETELEKANFELAQVSLWTDPLTTSTATKQTLRKHDVRVLPWFVAFIQPPHHCLRRTELWVLLH